jgi:hypothetical protein
MYALINFMMGQDYIVFWTAILALVTLLLVLVAYYQLKGIKKTSRGDFIHRYKQDIFKERIQKMVMLLQYSALNFKVKDIAFGDDIPSKAWPYFEVNKSITDQFKNGELNELIYNVYDIDDNLLGHFEDLGYFEKNGTLDISFIYNWFSFYIEMIWESDEIRKYVNWQREGDVNSSDIYENFEYLYNKCRSYREAKTRRKWIWVWKLKWRFFQR